MNNDTKVITQEKIMSDLKHTAGCAFPASIHFHTESGMTLRDYFESQQTAAWIIALGMRYKEQGATDESLINYAVEYGKRTADAMIKLRESATGENIEDLTSGNIIQGER